MTPIEKVSMRISSVLVLALVVSGCGGSSGPERNSISGKVTLDGQPVEEGQITFTPTGDKGTVTGAEIKAGAYSVPKENGPVIGSHKVSIRASRKTGRQVPAVAPAPDGTMIDVTEEYIPTKYNFESTLTAEVKSGDNKNVDFALTK